MRRIGLGSRREEVKGDGEDGPASLEEFLIDWCVFTGLADRKAATALADLVAAVIVGVCR